MKQYVVVIVSTYNRSGFKTVTQLVSGILYLREGQGSLVLV